MLEFFSVGDFMDNEYENKLRELNKDKKLLKMKENKYNDKWSQYIIPLIICATWFLLIKEVFAMNTSLLFNITSFLMLGVPSVLIVKKKRKKMLNKINFLNKKIECIQEEIKAYEKVNYDKKVDIIKSTNTNFTNSKFVHLEEYETFACSDSFLQSFFTIDKNDTLEKSNLKVRRKVINDRK